MTESMTDTDKAESIQETEVREADNMDADIQDNMEENTVMNMNVQVGDVVFSATLEKNGAVDAFVEMMRENPVVIHMSDYSGFEKVGSLGTSLPASNSQTTTHAGDIVLYNGNQIVIFMVLIPGAIQDWDILMIWLGGGSGKRRRDGNFFFAAK